MAKSKVPLVLRASFNSTTAEQTAGEQKVLDLSAYVDPLSGKVLKVTQAWFSIDQGDGLPLATTFYEADDNSGVLMLTTGTQTAIIGPQDDRVITSSQYYYQAANITGTSSPPQWFSVLPVPDMGFYVAADSMTFMAAATGAFDDTVRFCVVIEAERVKLTTADVNFLLVNQTFTG